MTAPEAEAVREFCDAAGLPNDRCWSGRANGAQVHYLSFDDLILRLFFRHLTPPHLIIARIGRGGGCPGSVLSHRLARHLSVELPFSAPIGPRVVTDTD